MKKETRSQFICRKDMSNGKIDMFTINVATAEKQEKKKYYEDMGYSVSVK